MVCCIYAIADCAGSLRAASLHARTIRTDFGSRLERGCTARARWRRSSAVLCNTALEGMPPFCSSPTCLEAYHLSINTVHGLIAMQCVKQQFTRAGLEVLLRAALIMPLSHVCTM
mmetsp:Transcript_52003/g.103493  ORF Transcript_52003/g.103493 Transcript_52003/m.103493 type:complete len:115 (+) Transcript_52003:204-548(+)